MREIIHFAELARQSAYRTYTGKKHLKQLYKMSSGYSDDPCAVPVRRPSPGLRRVVIAQAVLGAILLTIESIGITVIVWLSVRRFFNSFHIV